MLHHVKSSHMLFFILLAHLNVVVTGCGDTCFTTLEDYFVTSFMSEIKLKNVASMSF